MSGIVDLETLRYSGDAPASFGLELNREFVGSAEQEHYKHCLSRSVRVVPELFPDLFECIRHALSRVAPRSRATAFVYADAQAQASCLRVREGAEIAILLSSAIVELLTPAQLRFVIGHELGHFLFGHHAYPPPASAAAPMLRYNLLELARAAELSADRVGYLCVDSLDEAAHAILAVASGLSATHLRLDIGAYLGQLRDLVDLGGYEHSMADTHPMFPLRMKALMWFDMSALDAPWTGRQRHAAIDAARMERMIASDLHKLCGNSLDSLRGETLRRAEMWALLRLAMLDSRLSREEQSFLRRRFGDEMADAAIGYLRQHGKSGIEQKCDEAWQAVRMHTREQRQRLMDSLHDFASSFCSADAALASTLARAREALGLEASS